MKKKSSLYKPYADKPAELQISVKRAFEELEICQTDVRLPRNEPRENLISIMMLYLNLLKMGLKKKLNQTKKELINIYFICLVRVF
jgi:hypothetical protein